MSVRRAQVYAAIPVAQRIAPWPTRHPQHWRHVLAARPGMENTTPLAFRASVLALWVEFVRTARGLLHSGRHNQVQRRQQQQGVSCAHTHTHTLLLRGKGKGTPSRAYFVIMTARLPSTSSAEMAMLIVLSHSRPVRSWWSMAMLPASSGCLPNMVASVVCAPQHPAREGILQPKFRGQWPYFVVKSLCFFRRLQPKLGKLFRVRWTTSAVCVFRLACVGDWEARCVFRRVGVHMRKMPFFVEVCQF